MQGRDPLFDLLSLAPLHALWTTGPVPSSHHGTRWWRRVAVDEVYNAPVLPPTPAITSPPAISLRASLLAVLLGVMSASCRNGGGTNGAETMDDPVRHTPAAASAGDKEIAITIDDVPFAGWPNTIEAVDRVTDALLQEFSSRGIPVVSFVNEHLLKVTGEVERRTTILRRWSEVTELGNHTYSHLGFRKEVALDDYWQDIVRGDTVSKALVESQGKALRYFRHPYLRMGETRELEMKLEERLAGRGYRIAPVSVDLDDWMFGPAYREARAQGDEELARRVATEFLRHSEAMMEYCERTSVQLLGYQMKHILLLHADQLLADTFGELMAMLQRRGYRTITLHRALEDPAYRYPETYVADAYWLTQIAHARGKELAFPKEARFVLALYEQGKERRRAARQSETNEKKGEKGEKGTGLEN